MKHPKYVEAAFEALKRFNDGEEHHGLAVALGTRKNIARVTIDLPKLLPDRYRNRELEYIFGECGNRPILFANENYSPGTSNEMYGIRNVYELFRHMTNEQGHIDSLLSFDEKGRVIPIDGFLEPSKRAVAKFVKNNPDLPYHKWGTRHWSCAAASCYEGVTTMALSEERKMLTTFRKGRAIPELSAKKIK